MRMADVSTDPSPVVDRKVAFALRRWHSRRQVGQLISDAGLTALSISGIGIVLEKLVLFRRGSACNRPFGKLKKNSSYAARKLFKRMAENFFFLS